MPNEQALTPSQWLWVQCQMLLDDGVQACAQCDALSISAFCPACGARLRPEMQPCDTCGSLGDSAFCGECGSARRSQVEEAVQAGSFDWDAWAQSLAPFLGPMTAQERALLE